MFCVLLILAARDVLGEDMGAVWSLLSAKANCQWHDDQGGHVSKNIR